MLGIYFFLNFSSSLSINTPRRWISTAVICLFVSPKWHLSLSIIISFRTDYYLLLCLLTSLSSPSLGDYSRSSFLLSLVSIGLIAFATQVRVSCFFSSFIDDISCLSFWISQSPLPFLWLLNPLFPFHFKQSRVWVFGHPENFTSNVQLGLLYSSWSYASYLNGDTWWSSRYKEGCLRQCKL